MNVENNVKIVKIYNGKTTIRKRSKTRPANNQKKKTRKNQTKETKENVKPALIIANMTHSIKFQKCKRAPPQNVQQKRK